MQVVKIQIVAVNHANFMQIFVLQIVIANGAISHKTFANLHALAEQLQTRVGTLNTFLLLFCVCSITLEKPHPFPTRFLSLTNYQIC